jgi:hypothetical protein
MERKVISVWGSRSKVTRIFRTTHLSPLIHPPTKYQWKIFIRFEGNYYAILGQGHWVKVKGCIDTNLLHDTPLSPDTSSHQISIKNCSPRRYRAKGNLGFKVTGSRSKVAVTHLCRLIHPPNQKTSFVSKIYVQCGRELLCNFEPRSLGQGQRSHQH